MCSNFFLKKYWLLIRFSATSNPWYANCRISSVTTKGKKIAISIISAACWFSSFAQLTDNTSTFRNINNKSYFRFLYDNDYFTKTDEYYTQGFTLEYVHPSLKYFPVSRLLIKARNSDPQYGISINHIVYTPTNTESDAIIYGDRPFAAAISIKTFLTSSDSITGQHISSALSVGVMGPAAQGKEMQTTLHRWLKNELPKGWQNQIQNDVIINYQLNYEKKLFSAGDFFLLNGAAEARIGTLDDKVSGGFNFIAGHFNNPYHPSNNKKKIQYYVYGQSRIGIVAYDATLQGGLFNRSSAYIISSGDISRVTFQADAGIIVNFRHLYLSYTQSYLTKEFLTSHYHRWGGISIGCSF